MLIPKKNRVAIYEYLFKEGVCVAKKDFNNPKHMCIENVPNLHVCKAMQSLKSRGYVSEQFAWKHFYWYLTNEGITYLRDYLHLPPEIVPATLRRQVSRAETARPRPKGMDGGPRQGGPDSSDRDAYRRGPPGGDPKGGPGTDFKPEFRGGFGRGRGGGGGGFGAPQ
ncbi:40S ribosomal protein S10-like [Actinia tenebrosa]|uniref:40S ribosomal protein S10-like n=1 Tax=Actinia tenebrosa TaxID=6105 RepID=A0A6P8J0E9_ACTTE|nr:40S ribosomal protein S10-like [Actinia tenebrosa]